MDEIAENVTKAAKRRTTAIALDLAWLAFRRSWRASTDAGLGEE
jgi:hypothetical protein